MAVHLVVRQNGNTAQVVHAENNTFPENIEAGHVIFAVRSGDADRSQSIATAVAAVCNSWCVEDGQGQNNDETHVRAYADNEANFEAYTGVNCFYVYAYGYRSAEGPWQGGWDRDHVFYVGRGRRDRFRHHLRAPDPEVERQKVERIRFALGEPPWDVERSVEVVRHVAAFVGNLAPVQAAAVECFLIDHHFGIYRLTNRRRGDERVGQGDDRWIALPTGVTEFEEWHGLVLTLMNGGQPGGAQQLKKGLTARMINAHFQGQDDLLDVEDGDLRLRRANEGGDLATADGTDVAVELLLKHQDQPVMRVQLVMSNRDTTCRINLRPLGVTPASREAFRTLIAQMFFGGDLILAAGRIRNPGNPFFKPCAHEGVGDQDVDFDIRDLAKTYQLGNVPHFFAAQLPQDRVVTLRQVFNALFSCYWHGVLQEGPQG